MQVEADMHSYVVDPVIIGRRTITVNQFSPLQPIGTSLFLSISLPPHAARQADRLKWQYDETKVLDVAAGMIVEALVVHEIRRLPGLRFSSAKSWLKVATIL